MCGEVGSHLVPFTVYDGLLVQLRQGEQRVVALPIPPNPFSLPMTRQWVGAVLHVTIASPSPTRCLRLIGNNRLDADVPGSCEVATDDAPSQGVSDNYVPSNRWLMLLDHGATISQLPIAP